MADAPVALSVGSWFKMKLAGEDGNWSFFKIMRQNEAKDEVSVWGGDLDPNGRRQWHTFSTARVRDTAQPLSPRELAGATKR